MPIVDAAEGLTNPLQSWDESSDSGAGQERFSRGSQSYRLFGLFVGPTTVGDFKMQPVEAAPMLAGVVRCVMKREMLLCQRVRYRRHIGGVSW